VMDVVLVELRDQRAGIEDDHCGHSPRSCSR
jgi:hypothetical protein